MGIATFVDTSGFYAFLVRADSAHQVAATLFAEISHGQRHFVTTDYILDETATLLSARGLRTQAGRFLESALNSEAIRVTWCNAERFSVAADLFAAYEDKDWSFTDCLSFAVMEELGITDALTKDHHFAQAGRVVLL